MLLAHQVFKVISVLLVQAAYRAKLELPVRQDLQVQQDHKDHVALKDHRALTDHRDHRAQLA